MNISTNSQKLFQNTLWVIVFLKFYLAILNMFLLNQVLFCIKNLLWGFMERLSTESLVLGHNFWVTRYALFYPRLCMFYPISEGKTNAWFSSLIFKQVSYYIIMFMHAGRQLGFAFLAEVFFQKIILYPRIKSFLNLHLLYPIWL